MVSTDPDYVVITDEWLDAGKSAKGGWSRRQLFYIGVKWPLKKGWKRAVIGSTISRETAEKFHRLKNVRAGVPTEVNGGFTQCKKCLIDKPLDQFDEKRSGVRKAYCRECCDKIGNGTKAANRELSKLGPKKVTNGTNYISRNMWLKLLGFKSYRDYLASPLWKEIRSRVYKAKGSSCGLCGKPATQLHHNRYHRNDLTGKKIANINPVCEDCHYSIEFVDGKKQTLSQAKRAFKKKRKAYKKQAKA